MNSLPLHKTFGSVASDATDMLLPHRQSDFDFGFDGLVTPTPPCQSDAAPSFPSQQRQTSSSSLRRQQQQLLQHQDATPLAVQGREGTDDAAVPEDVAALQRLLVMYDNDLDMVQEHLTRETLRLQREQSACAHRDNRHRPGQTQEEMTLLTLPQTKLEASHSDPLAVESVCQKNVSIIDSGSDFRQPKMTLKDDPFSLSSLPTLPSTTLPPTSVVSSPPPNDQTHVGFSAAEKQTTKLAQQSGQAPHVHVTVPSKLANTCTTTTSNATAARTCKRPRPVPSKDKLQKILHMHHQSVGGGGDVPDDDGFYPIHLACRDFPGDGRLIGTMLCTNPNAGRLRVKAPRRPSTFGPGGGGSTSMSVGGSGSVGAGVPPKPQKRIRGGSGGTLGFSSSSPAASFDGSYPLHVALASNAPLSVIKLLVRQSPDVLRLGDKSGAVPLSVALRRGAPSDVLNLLLSTDAGATSVPDRRMNYPLHHACTTRSRGSRELLGLPSPCDRGSRSSSPFLPFLTDLVGANPGAVNARNFNGRTPLDLAQSAGGSGGAIDDETISFLHGMAYREREDEVIEAPDA